MNRLVKFPEGHEGGQSGDGEFEKMWHLMVTLADGERTACGLSHVDGYTLERKDRPKGGITCPQCLETVQYYKKILL